MIYVQLYFEFFKIGLFSVGGGLATIPFLQELGERTGWFSGEMLSNMIAVGDSTPGPIGVNMATYVGVETAGIFGGIVATMGTITPCVCIIITIARALEKFRESAVVERVFYGLRPASAALICSAAVQVAQVAFMKETEMGAVLYPEGVALGILVWGLMHYTSLKKLHPVVFLGISGLIGILCQMG